MGIRNDMPRHEGVWDGSYTYYNAAGEQIVEHTSRLLCRILDDRPCPYHQTNFYTWPNGRTETRDFPAEYRDRRVWWNNDLIVGWAAEVALDQNNRTMMLYWERTGDPSLYLYEMIQIADDGETRCRTWHWIRGGNLETRTAIQERRMSHDWRAIEAGMEASAG